jgi:hypothetical protein
MMLWMKPGGKSSSFKQLQGWLFQTYGPQIKQMMNTKVIEEWRNER